MLVVMSDSHTEIAPIQTIKAHYQHQDVTLVHCGDSELSAKDPIWQSMTLVRGNCDFDTDFPEIAQVRTTQDQKVLVTHGHLFGVNFGLDGLRDLAKAEQADIVCFGHLHTPVCQVVDGRLFLNPGSVSQPRGRYQERLYARVDYREGAWFIEYMTLEHQVYMAFELEDKRHD